VKSLLLALDYDGTYTADPAFWDGVIALAQRHGHRVVCVTMRRPEECGDVRAHLGGQIEVIPTSREAKALYMARERQMPDIWIDDRPHWITTSSAPAALGQWAVTDGA
jgi:hypothetical protein